MSSEPSAKGGRRLRIGKYQVIAHIATGGMGAVYKAKDVESGREVALKVLPPDLEKQPNLLARFRREADLGEKLKHENIVTLHECGEENGIHYLALEFIEGIDLQDYVNKKVQLEAKEARNFIIQAARALAHLHQHGIVHRDIKPSNFLITQRNQKPVVKLIDLGLARQAKDEEFRVTQAGTTLGTVDYMAPEQARDSGKADIRSDIYSLGCTLYQMLAGRPPFAEGSVTERLYKHAYAELPDIRQMNRRVPTVLVEVLKQMLAKDPAQRYQTPAALLRDLEIPDQRADPFQRDVLAALALSEDELAEAQPNTAKRKKRPGSKQESDDANESVSRKKPLRQALPPWLLWTIVSVVLFALVVGLVAWLAIASRSRAAADPSGSKNAVAVGLGLNDPCS